MFSFLSEPTPIQIKTILDDQENWIPTGRAFTINEKTKFCSEILPKHFNNVKYQSFVRKMKRWGFVAMMNTRRGSKPMFCHPLFIEGDTESCRKMRPVVQEEDIPASRQQRNVNFVPGAQTRQKVFRNSSSNSSKISPFMMASIVSQASTASPSLDGSSDSTAAQSSRGMLCLSQIQMSGNILPNNINTNQQHFQQQDTNEFSSQLHQHVQAHYQASPQQAIASIDMVLSNARNKAAVSRGELMAFETNGNPQMSNHSAPSLQGTSRSNTQTNQTTISSSSGLLYNMDSIPRETNQVKRKNNFS